MCQLAGVSRAGFIVLCRPSTGRGRHGGAQRDSSRFAVEHRRRYGYRTDQRRVAARGMLVNHKRVLRIIREDNLLAVQPRAFVVITDSDHDLEVFLNLASRMKLDRAQSALDRGYHLHSPAKRIRISCGDPRLVLAQGGRMVAGSHARQPAADHSSGTSDRGTTASARSVHHSDRGVQYASAEYVRILQHHQMISSMSRPANPYDNASCESS